MDHTPPVSLTVFPHLLEPEWNFLPVLKKGVQTMTRKPSRGIPAPFHAAVAFAVFFSLLGSPLWKGDTDLGGLLGILFKVQGLFIDREKSRDMKNFKGDDGVIRKGGRRFYIQDTDGTYDPPPPPPPPRP